MQDGLSRNVMPVKRQTRCCLLVIIAGALLAGPVRGKNANGPGQVAQWTRFEVQLACAGEYRNPLQDVKVEVDFTSPSGQTATVEAFWDGGKIWKVRFSPEEIGKWTYVTRCSRPEDTGLAGRRGNFQCMPYTGDNPLYRHGSIGVSENRRYLTHADGTPFFWLADTVWNGALKSGKADWARFLKDRVEKGFTAIQFVTTQWRAAAGNADARTAFSGRERITIDPVFYQWMDERVDALNRQGLVAAPVLIWTLTADDPGNFLPDDQIIILARYMVARYGAHHVIWFLGGDGEYRGEKAERWKKIGRAVFGPNPSRLATLHPGGRKWVGEEFRNESWFGFIGYQSGHGDDEGTFRWLLQGPPSRDWNREPMLPVINLEPNYEAHRGYTYKKPFDAHAVRRAAYWSLLVSPPAGVTYGAHGIWSWEPKPQVPMAHLGSGTARPWHEAMHLPGSTSMKHLKKLFASLEWWRLEPAPDLLASQPGAREPRRFVGAAKADDGAWALAYLPEGGALTLRRGLLEYPLRARWFNPRNGRWEGENSIESQNPTLTAPDSNDWVLWLGAKK